MDRPQEKGNIRKNNQKTKKKKQMPRLNQAVYNQLIACTVQSISFVLPLTVL